MHEIDSKKLEHCMTSLFCGITGVVRRTRYLSTNGIAIKDTIIESIELSDEVIKLIDEIASSCRNGKLIQPVKFHKSNWPKNPIVKDPLQAYKLSHRTDKLTHTKMITWALALYLTKYVDKSDYKYVVESLLFHEKSLTPYVKFMEITGVCRVYLPLSAFIPENINKEVSVEASHPLTHSQRRFLMDYININNIPSDKIYVDDYSKEQCIKRQLRANY